MNQLEHLAWDSGDHRCFGPCSHPVHRVGRAVKVVRWSVVKAYIGRDADIAYLLTVAWVRRCRARHKV